jgi:hypothetical protein
VKSKCHFPLLREISSSSSNNTYSTCWNPRGFIGNRGPQFDGSSLVMKTQIYFITWQLRTLEETILVSCLIMDWWQLNMFTK